MPVKKIGYAKYRLKPLEIITADAKKIRKAKPSIAWKDAVKQASKKYNAGNKAKPAPAKKPAPKKRVSGVATKSKSHTDKNRITANIQIGGKTLKGLDQLKKYGQLIQDKERAERALTFITGMVPANDRERKIKLQSIKNTRKVLAAIKQQLSIQKKLI